MNHFYCWVVGDEVGGAVVVVEDGDGVTVVDVVAAAAQAEVV
jgi:hypothetical protein